MENQFGAKLKQLRESKNWSQEKLAEKLQVSRQSVYKWETNQGYPSIDKLITLSDMFDVTIDALVKNEEPLEEDEQMDEKNFEQLTDPGFYIGMILIILGVFLFENENISQTFIVVGALTIVFFDDVLRSLRSLFKKTKDYDLE